MDELLKLVNVCNSEEKRRCRVGDLGERKNTERGKTWERVSKKDGWWEAEDETQR
jgi:hypothetical protein